MKQVLDFLEIKILTQYSILNVCLGACLRGTPPLLWAHKSLQYFNLVKRFLTQSYIQVPILVA